MVLRRFLQKKRKRQGCNGVVVKRVATFGERKRRGKLGRKVNSLYNELLLLHRRNVIRKFIALPLTRLTLS